jgi:hypothetical protein
VSYDLQAHRDLEREQCLALARAGAGWHAYALEKAERLVKEDPSLHGGLVHAVESEIGLAATKAARAAAKWMAK